RKRLRFRRLPQCNPCSKGQNIWTPVKLESSGALLRESNIVPEEVPQLSKYLRLEQQEQFQISGTRFHAQQPSSSSREHERDSFFRPSPHIFPAIPHAANL
ncbi:unnamed protein product, partial [Ectocarpus sp. 6 AP-2014]